MIALIFVIVMIAMFVSSLNGLCSLANSANKHVQAKLDDAIRQQNIQNLNQQPQTKVWPTVHSKEVEEFKKIVKGIDIEVKPEILTIVCPDCKKSSQITNPPKETFKCRCGHCNRKIEVI